MRRLSFNHLRVDFQAHGRHANWILNPVLIVDRIRTRNDVENFVVRRRGHGLRRFDHSIAIVLFYFAVGFGDRHNAMTFDRSDVRAVDRDRREIVHRAQIESDDVDFLQVAIMTHVKLTGSRHAERVLAEWASMHRRFVKVMPRDYKRALAELATREQNAPLSGAAAPARGMPAGGRLEPVSMSARPARG